MSFHENNSLEGESQIIINNPNFFQNFASVNYVILNKNNLSYPDQYKLKGAIIQERFFKINEKKLNELSLETIKATIFLSKNISKISKFKFKQKKTKQLKMN